MTETTSRVQRWTCLHCGTECTRPPTRGTRPKYCGPACQKAGWGETAAAPATCAGCGGDYRTWDPRQQYCSHACAMDTRRKPKPARAPRDQRTPLRRAYDTRDQSAFFDALRDRTTATASGCWIWTGQTKSGYATLKWSKRTIQVHRLSLEMKHRAELGTQAAHHRCANTACVNPEHLEPVTHAENTAEMLARTYMTGRIIDLEGALRELAPDHPLLAEISVRNA